jgi:hypothetical protein
MEDIDNPNLHVSVLYDSDPFWTEKLAILYENQNYYRFFPAPTMTRVEKLNSLSRFMIYLFILFMLFSENYAIFPVIGLVLIVVLFYIQKNDKKDQKKEKFCQNGVCKKAEVCVKPTIDNPFMNVTLDQYRDWPTRPKACNPMDPSVKRDIEEAYHHNLLIDADDLYQRGHSQRQFYTVPNTQLANEQGKFARWLYRSPPTCKEDTRYCMRYNYEDLRFKRYNPNIDRLDKEVDEG